MNGNALRYYKSAQALFLPVKPIEVLEGFELRLHKHRYFFCGAEPPINYSSSTRIGRHKYVANRLLEEAEIPVPKAVLVDKEELENDAFTEQTDQLEFPLVVKPLNERQGRGVLCNIQSLDELRTVLTQAFASYEQIIVEEFHANLRSYRVLVFNQKVIGVVLRHPSFVIGDGNHNINDLIELSNKERNRINEFLGPISLDAEAYTCLKEQGLKEDYIPRIGEKVDLGYTSNATRGGTYENINKNICKENRKLMIRVANTLNLKLVGIDIQCEDINKPIKYPEGVIIEANEIPSIRIHELPMSGPANLVTRKIMRHFIYRHPFAYLCSLYFNKRTAFYFRAVIVAIIIAVLYPLLKTKGII
ncbi:UDP-N-acetylmuramyl peptide synthase [Legionella rowbothamii]|uniref:UDP-N-acetylmuramyl peptide synthase n=1 Tax=Legionella rowbothamii TaxID=96229 RepID=UPI0013EF882B|nr:UDP-N-acetylmuramyl peptide synthase [Legionella rowbothamii]